MEYRRRSSRLEQQARAQEAIAQEQEQKEHDSGGKESVNEGALGTVEPPITVNNKRKKFVRIEKGPVEFRCCNTACCLSKPGDERGYSYKSRVGIVLDDDGDEALVVPEMMCPVSHIAHTYYEVLKGSNVELSVSSNEIRTSPTTPLSIDFDAIRAFERRHRFKHKLADSDEARNQPKKTFLEQRNSRAQPGDEDACDKRAK
ncbi:hypothetical protein JCM5350_003976 [Sporobolomyces pararoseus]